MTFFCIADKDSSLGFKLAGIETIEVSTRADAAEALQVARADKNTGIILVTEKAADHTAGNGAETAAFAFLGKFTDIVNHAAVQTGRGSNHRSGGWRGRRPRPEAAATAPAAAAGQEEGEEDEDQDAGWPRAGHQEDEDHGGGGCGTVAQASAGGDCAGGRGGGGGGGRVRFGLRDVRERPVLAL